jgi:hypothetical protein
MFDYHVSITLTDESITDDMKKSYVQKKSDIIGLEPL